uniref:Uncharacterized protein n=1 Tax=Cucumis melo TaxID=3656 RepID=A0A9I9E4X1_CUCME
MEKLLQRIQTPPIYPMGQPSPPSAQPSGQKSLHAPPLSGAWAHAPPSMNLTAHPICFYTSSPVQPSHPSGHPPSHAPPIAARQQPSKLSNLYSSTNLSVDPLQQHFFYRNGADQHHNRSGIEAGESSVPSGYGQSCVRGLRINQTYRRVVFEKGSWSPTSQPPAPVQDFEPPRDQGMENSTEPCTNNTMSENDRSDAAVLENMEEKNRGDDTERHVVAYKNKLLSMLQSPPKSGVASISSTTDEMLDLFSNVGILQDELLLSPSKNEDMMMFSTLKDRFSAERGREESTSIVPFKHTTQGTLVVTPKE